MEETGLSFETQTPHIPETRLIGEAPFTYAQRLAQEKALAIAITLDSDSTAIGCDTIVILGDDVLEKPADPADAETMLTRLSGNRHVVRKTEMVSFAYRKQHGRDHAVKQGRHYFLFQSIDNQNFRVSARGVCGQKCV